MRAAEDEVVRQHHRLNGHESEHTPGDCEGQGNLVCCSPWDHKELNMTLQLNSNNKHLPAVKKISIIDLIYRELWQKVKRN